MLRWILLAGALLGCADGGNDDIAIDASDAASDSRTVVGDTRGVDSFSPPNDGPVEAIFPSDDTPAPPAKICKTPMGTTATASGSYESTPAMAVDGNVGTGWNAGGYTGWLRLKFPAPITLDRVQFAALALPACNIPYTVSAGSKIGGATRALTTSTVWHEPIPVTAGTYGEIMIEAGPADSWITFAEVRVFDSTGACP